MQIESILIFVVLIALTSFSNKKKQAQQQRKKQQGTATSQQQRQTQKTPPVTSAPQTKKRSLQDVFKEMQSELETEYNKKADSQRKDPDLEQTVPSQKTDLKEKKVLGTEKKKKNMKPPEPTEELKQKSPIYASEIKDRTPFKKLDINQHTVFNGIIFSEILGKPKGKR